VHDPPHARFDSHRHIHSANSASVA
jgi:hypothetical protein